MIKMEPKQFYENLRNDREKVQTLAEELKAGGFEVYATGSSLERHDYNDIDLVIKPEEGMTHGDIESQLEKAIESIDETGTNKLAHAVHVTCTLPRYCDSTLRVVSKVGLPDSDKYAWSKIFNRRELNINGTKIDISVSDNPFGLNLKANYVKL